MEREIKIDKTILLGIVTEEQFREIMKLQQYYNKEEDDVKLIKKAIKKLDKPTVKTIAKKVEHEFGVIKLRRLLDIYEDVEWVTTMQKQSGRGRPMKLYKRIK